MAWSKTRRRVLDRDGGRCERCGSLKNPSVDHIIPRSLRGPDEEWNLRVLCGSCNSRRGARFHEAEFLERREAAADEREALADAVDPDAGFDFFT
jgi:5-methylcytosine-specific restriction endonuclease McrA